MGTVTRPITGKMRTLHNGTVDDDTPALSTLSQMPDHLEDLVGKAHANEAAKGWRY